jgi:hypothetical protein
MRLAIVLAAAAAASGCANGFEKYYTPAPNAQATQNTQGIPYRRLSLQPGASGVGKR